MEHQPILFTAPNGFPRSGNGTLHGDIQLVIVAETGEGMSVTNACATITTELVRLFKLNPARMLLIDRTANAALSGRSTSPYGESYNLVTFTWEGEQARGPVWKHLPSPEFSDLLNSVC